MEKYYNSSIKISTGFGMGSRQPLDARTICATKDDMNSIPETRLYEGFVCYCEDVKKYFKYDGSQFIELSVEKVIDNLTSTSTDIGLSANQGRVLKGLLDDLSVALKALETQVGGNDSQYKELFEKINSSIETINTSITNLQNKDTELSNLITALQKVDTTIQESISSLKELHTQDVTLLNNKDTAQDKEIENLKTKDKELQTSISDLQGDVTTSAATIQESISSLTELHTQDVTSLKNKDTAQDKEIENLKAKDKELQTSISDLQDDVTTGVASSGKVKVDETDKTIDYLENKIVSGAEDHQNGIYAVTLKKENEKLNVTVEVPVPVWKKL